MKRLGIILFVVIVVFFTFLVGKNLLAKSLLAGGLSQAAHVPVSIGSTRVELKNAKISLKDLRVKNPRGFHEDLMLDAPEIAIDFDLKAFWQGKTHFQEVRLDLSELVVIRNRDGQLNVDALRPKDTSRKESGQQASSAKTATPKFLIDKLILTVGKVTYKDYSVGPEPAIQEFNVGIRGREYSHIDNPQSLVSLIMFEALTRTTLVNLANLDLSAFQNDASGILSSGLNFLGSNKDKVQKVAQELLSIFK